MRPPSKKHWPYAATVAVGCTAHVVVVDAFVEVLKLDEELLEVLDDVEVEELVDVGLEDVLEDVLVEVEEEVEDDDDVDVDLEDVEFEEGVEEVEEDVEAGEFDVEDDVEVALVDDEVVDVEVVDVADGLLEVVSVLDVPEVVPVKDAARAAPPPPIVHHGP